MTLADLLPPPSRSNHTSLEDAQGGAAQLLFENELGRDQCEGDWTDFSHWLPVL